MMDDNHVRFMNFEKLFFRIQISFIIISILYYVAISAMLEILTDLGDALWYVLYILFFGYIFNFLTSFIRIIKYFVKYRKVEGTSIVRSIVVFLTSPIFFILNYILLLVLLLSMASCS